MKAVELVVASFLLFGACLVWPVLGIANRPRVVFGVPVLVVYLFVLWGVMVVALVGLSRRVRLSEDEP